MSKRRVNEIAGALGIPVPRQAAITSAAEAEACAAAIGYPIVLKKENTYDGMGVLLCRNAAEAVINVFRLRASGQVRCGIAKLGIGTDLCAVLGAELAGGGAGERQSSLCSIVAEELIALFPAELIRDAISEYSRLRLPRYSCG
jgi:predicted ATP-grasp superfamily ATP-dependent carboligase